MELQGVLMVGGVTVVVCAVLVLVSLFGSAGTSYEEAVAEQRRATSELLALARTNTKATLKKNKKAGKKTKEKKNKEVAQTGSERDSDAPADSGQEEDAPSPPSSPSAALAPHDHHHVEFGESIVVDVQQDKPIKTQIRKRGKEPKIKPILLNKDEASYSGEPGAPPSPAASALSNHFEQLHPKDEFELLHATLANNKVEKKEEIVEKKEIKTSKSGKSKHGKQTAPPPPAAAPAPAPEPPAAEEPAAAAQKERHNSGDSAKEQRKTKKNEKKQAAVEETAVEEPAVAAVAPLNLVSQPSDLTTDKLLKQAAPLPHPAPAPPAHHKPKKNKKSEQNVMTLVGGDAGVVNVGELVRLVSEASLSHTEIQILTDALLNKQHGPLPQHTEWTEGPNDPVQKLKKQLAEKEKALADEQEASQAVHAKLKELRASLNVERSRANAAVRAAEETQSNNKVEVHTLQARMQRLLDDNHALTQEKHLLQSKLQADGEAQAQRGQLEMHIQRLSETEAALVSQLQALQAEVGARVHEAAQARCEAAAAREATHQVQQHAADLAQQLQEANRVCGELEKARASAAHAEAAAGAELRAASERAAELQAEVQRLTRAAHTAAQAERSLEEADRQNRQLTNEIKSLCEQIAAMEEEAKKEHVNHQQNGLPPQEDNQKQKAEVVRLEGALEQLRGELEAARAAHADQRAQLNTLQLQLHQYRDKNNELRTKNWKVMEALQSAEKSLQSKVAAPRPPSAHEAVVKALEQQYLETAEVLRAACPQAAPAGAPADKDWLAAFADQLATVLRAARTAPAPAPPAAADTELRAQNAQLQELVDKYKNIIDDTEGVLSELQQNVSQEEQRWARLLHDKQRELDRLQQHTITQEPLAFAFSCIEKSLPNIVSEMQSKIDSLQEELERCGRAPAATAAPASRAGAPHAPHAPPHTFADVERGLEETNRLLNISEKHQVESLNGPSQVGLEEK